MKKPTDILAVIRNGLVIIIISHVTEHQILREVAGVGTRSRMLWSTSIIDEGTDARRPRSRDLPRSSKYRLVEVFPDGNPFGTERGGTDNYRKSIRGTDEHITITFPNHAFHKKSLEWESVIKLLSKGGWF